MNSSLTPRSRAVKWLIGMTGFCLTLYLMRYLLFSLLAQTLVSHVMHEKFDYKKKTWEEGVLIYNEVKLGDRLQMAELRLTPEFQLFPFHLSLEVYFTQPHWNLSSEASMNFNFALFAPTRWTSFKIDIEKGSLFIDQEPMGFIDLISGQNSSQVEHDDQILATLILSSEEAPYCKCEIGQHNNSHFFYQLNITEAAALYLQAFMTLLKIETPFNLQGGRVDAHLKGKFSSKDDFECSGNIEGNDLLLSTRSLDDKQGELDICKLKISGHWRADLCHSTLDGYLVGGRFAKEALLIEETEARLSIQPDKKPFFHIQGSLSCGQLKGPFNCHAEGQFDLLEGKFQWWHTEFPFRLLYDQKALVLQADLNQFPLELVNPFFPFNEGTITANGIARFDGLSCSSLEIKNLYLSKVKLYNGELFCDSITGMVSFSWLPEIVIEKAILDVEGFSYAQKMWSFSQGHGNVILEKNHFQKAIFVGEVYQIPIQISWQGALDKINGKVIASAPLSKWTLQKTPLLYDPETEFEAIFQTDKTAVTWKGLLQSFSDQIHIQGIIDLKTHLWKTEFQASSISLAHYSQFFPEASLVEGEVAVQGTADANDLQMAVIGTDVLFQTPGLIYQIPGKTAPLKLHWSLSQQKLFAQMMCSPSILHLKEVVAPIHMKGGCLKLQDGALHLFDIQACLEGTVFQGDLLYTLSPEPRLQVACHFLQGNLADLQLIQKDFFQKRLAGCSGRFVCGKDDFVVVTDLRGNSLQIRLKTELEDLSYSFSDKISLIKGRLKLAFDSVKGSFSIHEATMDCVLAHHRFHFQVPHCSGSQTHFSFAVEAAQEDISITGEVENKESLSIKIQKAKIGSSRLKEPIFYHQEGHEWSLQGGLALSMDSASHYIKLLQEAGFCKDLDIPEEVNGELELQGYLNSQGKTVLEAQSQRLYWQTVPVPTFKCHLEKKGNLWKIQDCLIGQMRLHASVLQESYEKGSPSWLIQNFSALYHDIRLQGSGHLYQGNCFIKVEGAWKEAATFEGEATWNLKSQEVIQSHLKFQYESFLATLSCPLMVLKNGKLTTSAIQTTFEHPALQEAIVMPLSLSLTPKTLIFQGPFSQGAYEKAGVQLRGSELHALFEKGVLHFQTKLFLNDTSLRAKGYILPFEGGRGSVQLMEGERVCQIDFSPFLKIERVEGSFFGIDCSLHRKEESLEGHLKLKTSHPLSLLLHKPEWDRFENLKFLGRIYQEGHFWRFQGDISGEEAAVFGTVLKQLQASVDYHPTRFEIRQLKVDDEAGHLFVKECIGTRSHPLKAWEVQIPYMRGQQIRPSLFRKIDNRQPQPKTFQIRQLTMTQIKGIIGRPLTFQGVGSLYFTQKEKRDPSFFDLPREFLKEWGLDLALLSPVRGNADIEISQGKIVFKSLKETFSEGGHSEFFLSPQEPSYIDFNGKLFFNLRIKQNVFLKLVQPFTLSIRGTWEKPQYTLR